MKKIIAAVAFLSLLGSLSAQEVRASVDKKEGFVGLPLQYSIAISGTEEVPRPDLVGFEGFSVVTAGQTQSSQYTIVNGRQTSVVSIKYSWELIPLRAGELTIPSVPITVGQETVHTPSGQVTIYPPQDVEGFTLQLQSAGRSAYMGESLRVDLKFYFSTSCSNLRFSLPGQSEGSLEGEDFILLESRPPQGTNLEVAQFPVGDRVFYGILDSEIIDGQQMRVLTLPLDLIPLSEGALELKGTTLSFTTQEGSRFRPVTEEYVIPANDLQLSVKELPTQIKESPNGVILTHGPLVVKTELSALEARPGDPLTLTMTLDHISQPAYCEIPALTNFTDLEESFSLPDTRSKGKVEGDSLIIVQTVRPKSVDSHRIPPIELLYLDLETGKVDIARSEPIALSMSSAGNLSTRDIEVFGGEEQRSSLVQNDRGIVQNKEIENLMRQGDRRGSTLFHSALFIWTALAPIILFVLFLLMRGAISLKKKWDERRNTDPHLKYLEAVKKGESLYGAFEVFIKERFFKGKSFTKEDLAKVAEKTGVDELIQVYEELEMARFSQQSSGENSQNVDDVVSRLESRI